MKSIVRNLILAAFACSFHLNAHGGTVSGIPKSHRVILADEGKWIPTGEQVEAALFEAQRYLESLGVAGKPGIEQVKSILASRQGFRVQAWGVERDGNRYVALSFFPAPREGEEDYFAEWKIRMVWVEDGGDDFWSIEYDPESKKCSKFSSSGPA